jgi:hypothetical protein
VQQEVAVVVNNAPKAKKARVCVEEGCDKGIVKNSRCYKHNKRFEAAQAVQAERRSIDEATPAELSLIHI